MRCMRNMQGEMQEMMLCCNSVMELWALIYSLFYLTWKPSERLENAVASWKVEKQSPEKRYQRQLLVARFKQFMGKKKDKPGL